MEGEDAEEPGRGEHVGERLRAVRAPRLIDRRLAGGRPELGNSVGMPVMFEFSTEPSDRRPEGPEDGARPAGPARPLPPIHI